MTDKKVVPLRPSRAPIIIELDKLDGLEGVRILSKEITRWLGEDNSRSIKTLAQRSNLYYTTVLKIHGRETQQPRFTTITLILKGLGFAMARFE